MSLLHARLERLGLMLVNSNSKICGRNQPWCICSYYPNICMWILRKSMVCLISSQTWSRTACQWYVQTMKIFVMLLNAVPDVMELFIGKVREGRQDNQI